MLMKRDQSTLLVVDIQERLLPHIHEGQAVLDNAVWLVKVAQRLGVPVMASEQYPKGIGHTVAVLRGLTVPGAVAEKLHFSCVAAKCLDGLSGSERPQVVVAGTESHVCVLQTVLDLLQAGYQVHVPISATCSRSDANRDNALRRMEQAGAILTNVESVLFELLRAAGSAEFKAISKLIV